MNKSSLVYPQDSSQAAPVAGHTPTPWGFGDLEKGSKRPMWEHVVDSHGTQICTVAQSVIRGCQVIGPETQEEAKANAAFIVTAVNSYDSDQAKIKALVGALGEAQKSLFYVCQGEKNVHTEAALLTWNHNGKLIQSIEAQS